MSKMRKPISWLLTLAMVFTMLPMSVFAADPVPQKTVSTAEDSPVQITKTLSDDGSSITMEAYVTGDVEVSSQTKPLDIVLVLDTSGSMGDKFGTGINYYTPTNKAWKTNEIEGKYILVDGVYYRIEKEYNAWTVDYTVYYKKDGQRITIGRAGWFATAYTGTLYTADYSRMGALKNAVNNFIDSVTEKSTATAPHQISIVTFAGGANTVKGLTSVQGTGATELKNAVDALSANGATRADLGLAKAKDVLNNGRTNTSKVVVFFTDGQPTSSSGFEKSVAHGAINSSKALKDNSGTTVYTIGVMEGANPADTTKDINKYMNAVSSKYPNATSEYEEAGIFKPEKWTVTLGDPAAKDYYFTASDPDGLNDVFQTISEETGSADVPVDATSVLYDTLSEYFAFPANASSTAKVQLADYKGNGEWGTPYAADGITPVIERKTISVTGFNYAENYVWDNSEAAAKFGGKKLILTFPIEADKECAAWQAPGLYDTNSQAGLTYGEGVTTTLNDSPNMKVDTYQVTYNWGEPDTAVTSKYTKPTDTRYYIPGQSYTVDDECTNTTAVNVTDEYGNINGTYTFSGWKLNGTVVTGNQQMPDSNVELNGEWTFAEVNVPGYKVTYDWGTAPEDVYDAEKNPVDLQLPSDGGEYVKGESYPVDTKYFKDYSVYTYDDNGNKTGTYTFNGWDHSGTITVTGNVTITGSWTFVPATPTEVTVTYKVVNGTWADGSTEITVTLAPDAQLGNTIPNVDAAKPGKGCTGGAWDYIPTATTPASERTEYTYTFEKIPEWHTAYDSIRIYMDDATQADFDALEAPLSQQVRIYSDKYSELGYRLCGYMPIADYWYTTNLAINVTAADIEKIALAKDNVIGSSDMISIPIEGNDIYNVTVSEGTEWVGLLSYKYLKIEIAKNPDKVTYSVIYDRNGADRGNVPTDPNRYQSGETVNVLENTGNLAKDQAVFLGFSQTENDLITTAEQAANAGVIKSFQITGTTTLYAVWAKDEDGDGTPDYDQYRVTYKIVNGTWGDGSTEIVDYVTFKDGTAQLGATPDVTAVKPNTNYLAEGKWDVEPVEGATITGDATYTYTLKASDDIWANTYDYIRIYMDEATQADFDALEGSLSQQVRIYSEKYWLDCRYTAPMDGYWWTENSQGVTANDISSIVLAKDKLFGSSSKIEIPMAGNDLYSVSVSEGSDYYPADNCEYTYLRIDITKNVYTIHVTFQDGNGSSLGSGDCISTYPNQAVTVPDVTVPEGKELVGWKTIGTSDDNLYEGAFDFNGLKPLVGSNWTTEHESWLVFVPVFKDKEDPDAGKTLRIYWAIDNADAASWELYDGNARTETIAWADRNNTFVMPKVKVKDGYHLAGWSVSGTQGNYWDAETYEFGLKGLIVEDENGGYVSITANIVSDEEEPSTKWVSVTFDSGRHGDFGNKTEKEVRIEKGSYLKASQIPDVYPDNGYKFVGWYKNGDKSELYSDADLLKMKFNSNATFTALYKEKGGSGVDVDDEYDVIYNANFTDGGYSRRVGYDEDDKVTVSDNKWFEREGYTFIGWNTKANGNGDSYLPGDTFRMPDSDVYLYAQWQKNKPGPDETGVSDWLNAEDHIAYMTGYPDKTFGPNRNMTRAEVAQMFYALLKNQNVTVTASFSDVPANAWYAKAVNTMATLGMVTGYPDGTFHPDATITRAEFTTIALAFADGVKGAECNYYDVLQTAWFYDYIAQATEYGWIGGSGDYFRPNDMITRAEVSIIVNNMLGRSADTKYVDKHEDELVTFPDVKPSYWAYYSIMETVNGHEYTMENGQENWK